MRQFLTSARPCCREFRLGCTLVLLAAGLTCLAQETQNVFIINIDGLRSNEGFESGHTNLPFIWDSLRPLGTLYTQFYNTGVTITNSAQSTVVTGTCQLLYNNAGVITPLRPHQPTIGEYYRKETGLPSDKAVFISGKSTIWRYPVSTMPGYGYAWAPSIVLNSCGDLATWDSLRSVTARSHPSLCYVLLGQVDEAGHTGDTSYYIGSIRQADSLVFEVWKLIQSDSAYRDHTALIVTSDHGRHDDRHGGWKDHGCTCHGCRHVLFLALGPDIKADRVVTSRRVQIDIAPTIGCLLDFGTPFAQGTVLTEMLRSHSLTPDPRPPALTTTT
ncbi:MAG: sulfatase-like hydrolase/transferase [candidate division WOR-3 bacterium]|nr:sulfatase-like hydrolase/transferase [candidate division WOR-3 bacterium]